MDNNYTVVDDALRQAGICRENLSNARAAYNYYLIECAGKFSNQHRAVLNYSKSVKDSDNADLEYSIKLKKYRQLKSSSNGSNGSNRSVNSDGIVKGACSGGDACSDDSSVKNSVYDKTKRGNILHRCEIYHQDSVRTVKQLYDVCDSHIDDMNELKKEQATDEVNLQDKHYYVEAWKHASNERNEYYAKVNQLSVQVYRLHSEHDSAVSALNSEIAVLKARLSESADDAAELIQMSELYNDLKYTARQVEKVHVRELKERADCLAAATVAAEATAKIISEQAETIAKQRTIMASWRSALQTTKRLGIQADKLLDL
tara:strand:+ start:3083 stop:4030 length:948 start_codon:yes stop_codon:yes gene_type:complete